MTYDVAIIGAGPAGYTAAERASSNGLNTILFEKNLIGGVCLNEGCIPTKALLYSAKILENNKSSLKYGIIAGREAKADLSKIIARKNKITKKLTAGIRMKLSEHNVTIVTGEAVAKIDEHNNIHITCEGETYTAKKLLLCCGSESVVPPIDGLNGVDFWTSKEALDCKEIPQSLAIIGGGVIGIEFASFFNSLGSKVSVIEMMPEILGSMDKETSAMLRAEYTKKGVDFYLQSKVIKVTKDAVIIEKDNELKTIEAQQILISAGRKPSVKKIEPLNLETVENKIKVNGFMQTSNPGIYACGDITGHSLLAHTAVREGEVAVNHILGKADKMSYKAIPGVVYTNPEIAGVGKTEEELLASGEAYKVLKLPMAFSGRFVAENEMGNGICKLIIDSENKITGCHILGNPASELIVIAGIAIEKEFTIEEFKKIVFPHPTVGEIIHESLYTL